MLVLSRKDWFEKRNELLLRVVEVTPKGNEIEVPYDKEKDEWILFPSDWDYDLIGQYRTYHIRYGRIVQPKWKFR